MELWGFSAAKYELQTQTTRDATTGTWPSQFGSVKCNSHICCPYPCLSCFLYLTPDCCIFHVQKFVEILCAHNYVASQEAATETQKCCQQAANSSELEPHPCLALCHSALTASQSFLIHAALRSNTIHIITCNNIKIYRYLVHDLNYRLFYSNLNRFHWNCVWKSISYTFSLYT